MTWIKFLLWLSGSYAGYYLALVLWDLFGPGKGPLVRDAGNGELTFIEDILPQRAEPEESAVLPGGPAVVSSGGVSLKHLFTLAREEAIEFTRPVSF